MIARNELEEFSRQWAHETDGTITLMQALPPGQYDFRPDAGGRSLGELAWHLAEVEAYTTLGIARGEFRFDVKPPNMSRPKSIEALAPAFRVVHDDAAARVGHLVAPDLDRELQYADGTARTIRNLLWHKLLLHAVHHRGQLTLLCRLAGGRPPELFGRTRETTPTRQDAAR